jgi:hypothetical protein
VVACGYADGYPRTRAPTGTPILVDGRRTRTLGRVSMDMLACDHPSAGRRRRLAGHLWGEACRRRGRQRGRHHQLRVFCALAPACRSMGSDGLMAKVKTVHVCPNAAASRAAGRASVPIAAWNTLVESVVEPERRFPSQRAGRRYGRLQTLADIQPRESAVPTGIEEFDRVLGGGLVPGGVVLIGGDPGIGKSTLLLQALALLSGRLKALYVSGEESAEQVALRAARLQLDARPAAAARDQPRAHPRHAARVRPTWRWSIRSRPSIPKPSARHRLGGPGARARPSSRALPSRAAPR